jgi:hypothetical protein
MALFDASNIIMQGAANQMALAEQRNQMINSVFDRLAQKRALDEAQAQDYEGAFMKALYNESAGLPTSPDAMARAQTFQKAKMAELGVNPTTGETYPKFQPVLGGLSGLPQTQYQSPFTPPAPYSAPQGNVDDYVPLLDEKALMGGMPMQAPAPMPMGANNFAMPPVGDNYADIRNQPIIRADGSTLPAPANPKQAQERYAAELDIAKELAKKAPDIQEKEQKAQQRDESKMVSSDLVLDSIGKAKKLISPSSVGYGGFLQFLPMTDARAIQAALAPVRSAVTTDTLAQMRAESPTGGAMGNLTEKELPILQEKYASFDQFQRPEEFRAGLETIEKQYISIREKMKKAYEQDLANGIQVSPTIIATFGLDKQSSQPAQSTQPKVIRFEDLP